MGVGRERMRGREVGQELRKKQKELGNSIENGQEEVKGHDRRSLMEAPQENMVESTTRLWLL